MAGIPIRPTISACAVAGMTFCQPPAPPVMAPIVEPVRATPQRQQRKVIKHLDDVQHELDDLKRSLQQKPDL